MGPRALMNCDPDLMVRTIRGLLAELKREEAAGRRPGDGTDQPSLFEAKAQPSLWE